jgi:hypothetical protein
VASPERPDAARRTDAAWPVQDSAKPGSRDNDSGRAPDVATSGDEVARKRIAELEAESAGQKAEKADLEKQNAALWKKLAEQDAEKEAQIADLKAVNVERDRKDAARDAQIAEQNTKIADLAAKLEDRGDADQAVTAVSGHEREATGPASETVIRAKVERRWHLPSDATNAFISAGAGDRSLSWLNASRTPQVTEGSELACSPSARQACNRGASTGRR